MQKKHTFEIQINAISDTDNPTKKEVEFILHDFLVSHNYAFISKETALPRLDTLKDMPIVCQYFPVSHYGAHDDALGGHAMYLDEDRNTGEEIVAMQTFPIGVFTSPAEIKTIEVNGELKEVVVGKGILWASRYPNIVGLLKEWVDDGIAVKSSMEILYDTYKVEDGITEILSYVYEGHCLLNSSDRGEHRKVSPAYDVSQLTRLVAQAYEQRAEQEVEKMQNEELVQETTTEEVQETQEVVEEVQAETVEETTEEVVEAVEEAEETVTEVEETQEAEEAEVEATEESKMAELETALATAISEKDALQTQLNEVQEQMVQLNTSLDELKPYKEAFEKEQFEKALAEKQEFYSAKFKALGASDTYETEEVQTLLASSISESTEGVEAKAKLNSMLVELLSTPTEENVTVDVPVKELASKRENLLPTEDSFESRYSV